MASVLQGKTALVTGAGRGIGRAIALALARQGANLILVARSADQLAETAATANGSSSVTVEQRPADLVDAASRQALIDDVRRDHARVDVLINNAGAITPLGATVSVDLDDYRRALELNVLAPVALSAAFLPGMIQAGWGRIVNIASGVTTHPETMIGGNAYVTSKSAVDGHTANLAAEVAGTGVTVNLYRPGRVDTELQAWVRSQDPAVIGERLHAQYTQSFAEGELYTPEASAASLVARIVTDQNGQFWAVRDPLPVA